MEGTIFSVNIEEVRELLKQPPVEIDYLNIEREVFEQGTRNGFFSMLLQCKRCNEKDLKVVLPQGAEDSSFIFIGRNPGVEEKEIGSMFHPTLKIGKMFQKYLNILSILREECYITDACFCGGVKEFLTEKEIALCSQWKALEFQFLKKAKFVFLLGNDAVRSTINPHYSSIRRSYGRVYKKKHFMGVPGHTVYLIPIHHPGYIYRNRPDWTLVSEQMVHIREYYIREFKKAVECGISHEELLKWEI